MADLARQEGMAVRSQDNVYDAAKLLMFLAEKGFTIHDDHKHMIKQYARVFEVYTDSDGLDGLSSKCSSEIISNNDDSKDNSSIFVSEVSESNSENDDFKDKSSICVSDRSEKDDSKDNSLIFISEISAEKDEFKEKSSICISKKVSDNYDSKDKSPSRFSETDPTILKDVLNVAKTYVETKETISGNTPLHFSAEIGDTDLIRIFLKAKAKVNDTNKMGRTPLHLCVQNDGTTNVEALLNAGANVNAIGYDNRTPLHFSCYNGYTETVKVLLNAGAYVHAQDYVKRTPLHLSSYNGHKEIVNLLLKAGADVNSKDHVQRTPLDLSAYNGHTEIFEILLEAGARFDFERDVKGTPLIMSANLGNKEIVEVLIKAGANVNSEDYDKQTPLHKSANNGHKEIVEILLEAGADVNAENLDKRTPLHMGAYKGHKEIVEILLKAGAEVNAEDNAKRTALYWSAYNGQNDILEILIKAGADVNTENYCKQTPLHKSVISGHHDIVQTLINNGANINALNNNKQTPLHLSVRFTHDEITELLIQAGASVNKKDVHKKTAWDYMNDSDKKKFSVISKKVKFGFKSLFYSKSKKVESVQKSGSVTRKTEFKQTEIVSSEFSASEKIIFEYEDNSANKARNDSARSGFNLLTIETLVGEPPESSSKTSIVETSDEQSSEASLSGLAVKSSEKTYEGSIENVSLLDIEGALCPSSETDGLSKEDIEDLNSIRQQFGDHCAKFSPKQTESWDTKCCTKVRAAFHAGRIIMPTTINFTKNKYITNINTVKNVKKIQNSGTETNLSINQAEFVGKNIKVVHDDIDDRVDDNEDVDNVNDDDLDIS